MEAGDRRTLNDAMVRLADGDRSAFTPVFETLWPLLFSFARRVLGDSAAAEDVAQHALVVVFAQASRFDPSRDAAAWAIAIAANECRNARRRSSRWASLAADSEERFERGDDPEARAIARDLLSSASALLGELKPADAAALEAAWTGRDSGLPAATLRKRVQRATERLRALWRSRHGTA